MTKNTVREYWRLTPSFVIRFSLIVSFTIVLIFCLISIVVASGGVIAVNTLEDELNNDGDCSLREAIQAANTDSIVDSCQSGVADDLITLPTGIYTLSLSGGGEDGNNRGDLDILSNLTISGVHSSSSLIDGNQLDRIFDITTGVTVAISGVQVRNGRTTNGADSGCGETGNEPCSAEDGGGILNAGFLTLNNLIIRSNSTGNGGNASVTFDNSFPGGHAGDGAGLFNRGTLIVNDSVIDENLAGHGGKGDLGVSGGQGGRGGGIFNTGIVILTNSTVQKNATGQWNRTVAPPGVIGGDGAAGGGIFNAGIFTLTSSTISTNTTYRAGDGGGTHGLGGDGGNGGGIFNAGTLYVENSTISENQTGLGGYGFSGGGSGGDGAGLFNRQTVTLTNVTISGNQTGLGGQSFGGQPGDGGDGGGIYNENRVSMRNTIVAANHTAHTGPDCHGTFVSFGNNLIQDTEQCVIQGLTESVIQDQYAWLRPLAANGGPTLTHAFYSISPAIDNGSCSNIVGGLISTDQRGGVRPIGNSCDIGAYESIGFPIIQVRLPLVIINVSTNNDAQ
ncbi:CSLREA domain-containing protein [Chloroflexi bacterium TSY]|nr:CSLREA domain-containing protein [Chloroflexi bacterium TSY]